MNHPTVPHFICSKLLCLSIFAALASGVVHTWAQPKAGRVLGPIARCWQYEIDEPAAGAFADRDRIFFATVAGRLRALDTRTGQLLWSSDLGGEVDSNLLGIDGAIFVVTTSRQAGAETPVTYIRSISRDTGITRWKADLPAGHDHFLGSAGDRLVAVSREGNALGIDPESGVVAWRHHSGAQVAARPVIDGAHIVMPTKNSLTVLSGSGRIVSDIPVRSAATAIALATDADGEQNILLTADDRGYIRASDLLSGKALWKFKLGAAPSFLMPTTEGVIAASADNFLYRMGTNDGDVVWKRRLPGRFSGEPRAVGSNVAVAVIGYESAFLIEGKTGRLLNKTIPQSGGEASAIILAADEERFVVSDPWRIVSFAPNGCEGTKTAPRVEAPAP
jgi:outer membrane protein assembly factor BamB